ncbi:MAG TPA: hypothetical protein VF598_03725 [Hymenobacter sp.]|jgi:hypothetical protein
MPSLISSTFKPYNPAPAGLYLGVLIGNLALLWVWVQVPAWYRLGSADVYTYAALHSVWLGPWVFGALLLLTNAAVLRWATLPLALPHLEHAGPVDKTQFWKHSLVFWLCVVFHLACAAFEVWAIMTTGLDWQRLF